MWRPDVDLQLVLDATQVTLNDQLGKPRLLPSFAQCGRFQRFTGFYAATWHLNASVREIRLPEDQQAIRLGDVSKRFGNMKATRHLGFDEPITSEGRRAVTEPDQAARRPLR